MKIVVLDGYTENPGDLSWGGLEALGELTVYDRTPLDDEKTIIGRIGDAEVVYTNKTPLSGSVIRACNNLKFIGVLATGYNVVDVETAKKQGIPVSNIPSYGTKAVAQYTVAMLLEICHRIGYHSDAVENGRWSLSADWCFWDYPLIELAGKTAGIIGFGRIGQETAKLLQALGMTVLAYDQYENETGRAIAEYVSLDQLLAQSDVISLHCPLLPDTEGMINTGNIARMKDGVIIINTSRGPLVCEADLAAALQSKKVYAAALDVVAEEPIKKDNPLIGVENCLITPHIAWATKESRQRLMNMAVDNLKAFMAGEPANVVNR